MVASRRWRCGSARPTCAYDHEVELPLVLAERPDAVDLEGADRARFLNAYLTCDVRQAQLGQRIEGFFTSREGRVIAPAGICDLGDRLRVDLPPEMGEPIVEHLRRFVIADRVTIHRVDTPGLRLVGSGAAAKAEELAGSDGVLTAIGPWLTLPSAVVWGNTIDDTPAPDEEAIETARIAALAPRFGVDYQSGEYFPQELGASAATAVSYEKGCYLGQEVVARIHWRGRVQRGPRLVALGSAAGVLVPGLELIHDGRPAGRLTSICAATATGLAILHSRVARGDVLEAGSSATLVTVESD